MYIITLIDEGALQASTYTLSKDKMAEVVESWYGEHYSDGNIEGYIAVEVANQEGEEAARVIQVNLDEDADDVRAYLDERYSELN